MTSVRVACALLLCFLLVVPIEGAAMSERPRPPAPAEANVPRDLQRVILQVDGMY